MFDHLSLGVADLDRAAAFYDAALGALGHVRLTENPRHVSYGPPGFAGEPRFAILVAGAEARAAGPRFHLAFAARDRDAVDRFPAAAVASGGADDGPPGVREQYHPGYDAASVVDPDGNRLEVVVHEPVAR